MKEELSKLTDKNINQDGIDAILKGYVKEKFDAELRLDLEEDLRQNYQFSKENKLAYLNGRKRRKLIYFIATIAAGLGLLIIALNFSGFSSDEIASDPPPWPEENNVRNLASSYLAMSEIHHSGALKGNTINEDIRRQAIRAFNIKEWAEAEQYFSQIEEKTEEDIFYSGISSLYNQKYEQAIIDLASVTITGTSYKEEANWYLAIAYVLHGDEASAKKIFSTMKSSSWNYEEAQKLLNLLETH